MIELKKCPFCGGEATMDSSGKKYQVWCKRCSCIHMGEFYNTEAEAIAAWNRRAQPENEPLTLDELRGMDGEPVWAVVEGEDGEPFGGVVNVSDMPGNKVRIFGMHIYAVEGEDAFTAYRHKPERSEGE